MYASRTGSASRLLPDLPAKSFQRTDSYRRSRVRTSQMSTTSSIDALLSRFNTLGHHDTDFLIQPYKEVFGGKKSGHVSRPSSGSSNSSTSDRSSDASIKTSSTYATSNAAHESGREAYRQIRQQRQQYRKTALETLQLVQQTISVITAERDTYVPQRRNSGSSDHGSSVFSDEETSTEEARGAFDAQLQYYAHTGYAGERRYGNYL